MDSLSVNPASYKFDVFISFHHKCFDIVSKFARILNHIYHLKVKYEQYYEILRLDDAQKLIECSGYFFLFITEDYINSVICMNHYKFAYALNKRIIFVTLEKLKFEDINGKPLENIVKLDLSSCYFQDSTHLTNNDNIRKNYQNLNFDIYERLDSIVFDLFKKEKHSAHLYGNELIFNCFNCPIVYISCNLADKNDADVGIQVKYEIAKRGYFVTLNEKDVFLPERLKRCSIVIILLTNTYQRKDSCKLEADYTKFSNQTTFVLCDFRDFVANTWSMQLLRKTINIDMNGKSIVECAEEIVRNFEAKMSISYNVTGNVEKKISLSKLKAIKHWSKDDVFEWLRRNGLSVMTDYFRYFDGTILFEMHKMRLVHPTSFYSLFLDYDIVDISNFTSRLDNLFLDSELSVKILN